MGFLRTYVSRHLFRILLLAILCSLSLSVSAAERLANIFSDNMVLQRDRAVPIWGWAEKGQAVKVKWISIAGENKRFFWADAVIEGSTLVVSSKEVPKPVAVRYAFATNPDGANFYNKDGLPASPFRTDNWLCR